MSREDLTSFRPRVSQEPTAMPTQSQQRAMLLLIVLSGVIIALCMGLRQSLGIFMRPMTVELGISAATFGFAIALQNIVWGVSQPFVGAVADRYGARPVLIATSFIYAAGLALMVFARTFPGALGRASCRERVEISARGDS